MFIKDFDEDFNKFLFNKFDEINEVDEINEINEINEILIKNTFS